MGANGRSDKITEAHVAGNLVSKSLMGAYGRSDIIMLIQHVVPGQV